MVRLVATRGALSRSPRPCAGDGSVGCYARACPFEKPPALCRGWFGWLLREGLPFREAPGLVPGILRLVATTKRRHDKKPPALCRGWFGWLLLKRRLPSFDIFSHLRRGQISKAADISARLPYPPNSCTHQFLCKSFCQRPLPFVHQQQCEFCGSLRRMQENC